MRNLRSKLTYSNVMVTVLAFIVLAGGSAYAASNLGKNAIKSKNIAPNAVRTKNLAKNAVKNKNLAKNAVRTKNLAKGSVTAAKIKAASITRTQMAAGTLAGLQVAEVQSNPVPGFGGGPSSPAGTPVPLAGTTTFTPAAGKSYMLLTELRGNPIDADGDGGEYNPCFGDVVMLANSQLISWTEIYATAATTYDVYKNEPVGTKATPIGLQEQGKPVTLTAISLTNGNCGPMTASFKGTVIELG